MKLYVGLVHYPISNKLGETVTTSVTNMDIHDISRSCKTYGVEKFYLITPLQTQHEVVQRILDHWKDDKNCAYNPDRFNALSLAELSYSLEDSMKKIEQLEGKKPLLVVTGANIKNPSGSVTSLNERIMLDNMPCYLVFGTGWGLHASVVEQADFRLNPLKCASKDDYNHLSVRSAVAIYLDRLRGSL